MNEKPQLYTLVNGEYVKLIHAQDYARENNINYNTLRRQRCTGLFKEPSIYLKHGHYILQKTE